MDFFPALQENSDYHSFAWIMLLLAVGIVCFVGYCAFLPSRSKKRTSSGSRVVDPRLLILTSVIFTFIAMTIVDVIVFTVNDNLTDLKEELIQAYEHDLENLEETVQSNLHVCRKISTENLNGWEKCIRKKIGELKKDTYKLQHDSSVIKAYSEYFESMAQICIAILLGLYVNMTTSNLSSAKEPVVHLIEQTEKINKTLKSVEKLSNLTKLEDLIVIRFMLKTIITMLFVLIASVILLSFLLLARG